ncbi:MAG: nitronate monooxygenase [Eubacteriales bacterium]|nr:nitronate monooxygenase [Eubacteriales bacterium]
MKLPALKIANIVAALPIIQGGMAVRISTSPLAAAVANEGGIGVIAGTGMDPAELQQEIRKARSLTRGILGVNVLFAASQFAELVSAAIAEKIDLVISGAGFSRDMFGWGKASGIPIVPIVSSAKLAILAEKMGAAAVIVEGKEAGGHLGTDRPMKDILVEVKAAVQIPVIAAGGVIDGYDIAEAIRLGADGVQMGTRFAASVESNASDDVKQMYIDSMPDDVIQVHSPVGLPGQALRKSNPIRFTNGEPQNSPPCSGCLKRCDHTYCIMEALKQAQKSGNVKKSLVFVGEQVFRIKEILPVHAIFEQLKREWTLATTS